MRRETVLTIEQKLHLARIKHSFETRVDEKYKRGQKAHGGNLFELSALDLVYEALSEAIDQVVYLDTLREVLINEQKVVK